MTETKPRRAPTIRATPEVSPQWRALWVLLLSNEPVGSNQEEQALRPGLVLTWPARANTHTQVKQVKGTGDTGERRRSQAAAQV